MDYTQSIDYLERELAELVEIYEEQANVFSALVSIFGTRALSSLSNDEKHRHADVAFLAKADWKYEKSGAGDGGGGRTHTFGVRNAANRLRDKAVYKRADVIIRGGRPIPRNGHGGDG